MKRYIDADKLRKDILDLPNCYNGFSDAYDKAYIIDVIDEQPTVNVCPYWDNESDYCALYKPSDRDEEGHWAIDSNPYRSFEQYAKESDFVEVVRCKDCEFSSMPEWDSDEVYCSKHNNWFKINGYCHLGRRENAKTN